MIDFNFFLKNKWVGEGVIIEEGVTKNVDTVMKICMTKDCEKTYIREFTLEISMDGKQDAMENYYTLTIHKNNTFHVLVSNENWGHVEGGGFFRKNFIGWELSDDNGMFDAYESIEMKNPNEFVFLGEYKEKNGMRTRIEGKFISYESVCS